MFTLSLFPPEVFLHILAFLSAPDILNCRLTCTQINNLIETSSHLQLIIELAVQGLRFRLHLPRGECTQAALTRLEAFQQSREAWKRFKPVQTTRVELSQYEYEISEGLFGHAMRDEAGNFRGLEFVRLWVTENGSEDRIWKKYEDVGVHMSDFTFDHAEDLLVLVQSPVSDNTRGSTKRLFLRTLSDNNPHPRASKDILESPGDEIWRLCDIKICGNILGVHFDNSHQPQAFGRLTVWDWPSGEILRTCSGVGGYAFLTPAIIMNVTYETGLQEEGDDTPLENNFRNIVLEIWKTDGLDLPFIRLSLPTFKHLPGTINVFSERPSADSPNFPSDLYISPYTHDETAERIVAIQFLAIDQYVILSVQKLLRILDQYFMETTTSSELGLKWTDWGTDSTFWLRARSVDAGYTSVSGGRFVALTGYKKLFHTDKEGRILKYRFYRRPLDHPNMDILVLDFNRRPIIRDPLVQKPEEGEGIKEWKIDDNTLVEEATCRLPFRAFQYTVGQSYLDLVLGIDHLVAITRSQYAIMQFCDL